MRNRTLIVGLLVFALLLFAALPALAQSEGEAPGGIPVSLEGIIIVCLLLGAFVRDIIGRLILAWQEGRDPDPEIVESIEGLQDNRDFIDFWERQYEYADANVKRGYDLIAHGFDVLSKLTPWTFDDRLADLLKDIQARDVVEPNPPAEPAE